MTAVEPDPWPGRWKAEHEMCVAAEAERDALRAVVEQVRAGAAWRADHATTDGERADWAKLLASLPEATT